MKNRYKGGAKRHDFTLDELNIVDPNRVTGADNRTEQISNLEEMRGYLREYETDLMQMTDGTLAKLRGMSDTEFADFRRSTNFDLEALGHV